MKCNEMRERQRGGNARAAAWRNEMRCDARAGTLRPIVLIGTSAAKCALGSTSILAGIAKFATIAYLLTF